MQKHRCKICSKVFNNGRALGGHMRSHLASFPIPPKKKTQHPQFSESTQSDSSSTHSEDTELVGITDEKLNTYGLRENPKRSSKASDPEFLDAGSVVQDRESETESTQNLTRKPSKRLGTSQNLFDQHETEPKKTKSESGGESTPASSVSDPGHQDEEVAISLMMLSRDVWDNSVVNTNDSSELKMTRFECVTCKKVFKTSKALKGHKTSNKECHQDQITTTNTKKNGENVGKIYQCSFCYRTFETGQALGGHKRSHLLGSSSSNTNNTIANIVIGSNGNTNVITSSDHGTVSFVFDLNLPAPVDDDDGEEDHCHNLDFH